MEYLLIFISAIFVNNIVLSQFLGICPFLGVSKKVDTAIGMGGAIAFVLTLATIITWCVQKYVLDPFGLQYLQTLAFILVIAALVQGRDYPQEGFSCALSGARHLPAFDYYQLCRAGCSHPGYPEGLQSPGERGLRLLYRSRLCPGSHCLCRHSRAAGFGPYS